MATSITGVRIGIVDDHAVIRSGVTSMCQADNLLKVVFEGGTATDAYRLVLEHSPDVLLLDVHIPGGGLEALKEISRDFPKVRCIMFTGSEDASIAMAAIAAGAKGYILKGVSAANLISAIHVVMENRSYVSPEFAWRLVEAAQEAKNSKMPSDGLHHRESQIIKEVEKGSTNREVAERLKISEKTVKHYMTSIMQKFGVSNRVGAVVAYRLAQHETHH